MFLSDIAVSFPLPLSLHKKALKKNPCRRSCFEAARSGVEAVLVAEAVKPAPCSTGSHTGRRQQVAGRAPPGALARPL